MHASCDVMIILLGVVVIAVLVVLTGLNCRFFGTGDGGPGRHFERGQRLKHVRRIDLRQRGPAILTAHRPAIVSANGLRIVETSVQGIVSADDIADDILLVKSGSLPASSPRPLPT